MRVFVCTAMEHVTFAVNYEYNISKR